MCIRDRIYVLQHQLLLAVTGPQVAGTKVLHQNYFWCIYPDVYKRQHLHRGDVYATHGMGPACQVLNIHRGDRMKTLVSMDTDVYKRQPSGRCIQRPYESGKDRNYELDIYNRYEHGEFFSRDSIDVYKRQPHTCSPST